MTAVIISNLPRDIAHCNEPISDWYLDIPSSSSNSESSSSGWSPFSNGEVTFVFGLLPNSVLYPSNILSMNLFGEKHSTPRSSLKKSHPKWYSSGPVPFNLKWYSCSRVSVISLGFSAAIARSSTYTAMYSYLVPFFLIHMSGSTLHGVKPILSRILANFSCHLSPLDLKPYNALLITSVWPSLSPNSGPAMICTFSWVFASKYAFPISVAHSFRSFSSAKKRTILKPLKDTTPEYTLVNGISVLCPSATNLALCLPSCFISYTKCTPIFFDPSGAFVPFPRSRKVL